MAEKEWTVDGLTTGNESVFVTVIEEENGVRLRASVNVTKQGNVSKLILHTLVALDEFKAEWQRVLHKFFEYIGGVYKERGI